MTEKDWSPINRINGYSANLSMERVNQGRGVTGQTRMYWYRGREERLVWSLLGMGYVFLCEDQKTVNRRKERGKESAVLEQKRVWLHLPGREPREGKFPEGVLSVDVGNLTQARSPR